MALRILNFAGPELRDGRNYNGGAALPAGYSIFAAPTPDGGNYWIEANGGDITPITVLSQLVTLTDAVLWIGLGSWRLTGAPPSNDVLGILRWSTSAMATDPRTLVAVWDAASQTFRLALRTAAGVEKARGLTPFKVGDDVSILVEFAGGMVRVYANGQLEMQFLSTPPPSSAVEVFAYKQVANNITRRWRGFSFWGSDQLADRPDPLVEVRGMFPNGNTASNEFGDMTSPSNHLGHYAYWDDFDPSTGGIADDDTTFNACPAALDYEQLSTLTDIAVTKPIRAVLHRARARNTSVTKAWAGNAALRYGGRLYLRTVDVGTANAYGPELALWAMPPDGSVFWTPAAINSMEGGAATEQTVGGGGVGVERRWTAIAWEVLAAGAFPAPQVGAAHGKSKRRRSVNREELERAGLVSPGADLDEEFAVLRLLYGF